jgi:hypothetical protein
MVTMDAEIIIDIDIQKNVMSLPALLTHFLRVEEMNPVDGALYYVVGKISCVVEGLDVGPHPCGDPYQFIVNTEVVSHPSSIFMGNIII